MGQFDALSNQQRATILQDFRTLVDDTDLSVSVTYKSVTGTSYDAETGTDTLTTSEATVNAIKGRLSAEAVDMAGAEVEVGDIMYLIDKADLPATPPTTEDIVVEGSATRHVVDWSEDPLAQWYRIVVRDK